MEKRWPGAPRHPTRCMVTYLPSQVCSFSCKRSTMIYKQLYENLARPSWLEGRVPRVPGSTFLHINRALMKVFVRVFGRVCQWVMSRQQQSF